MIGLEVENVETLAPFIIAQVISAEQHPNADRLRVCMVDIGSAHPVQVVCGAPNARAGMKGVFAPPGAFIPGKNMTLDVGTIRGVESHGMLCSGFELQLSEDHEGILDLPQDAPVGARFTEWAHLHDPLIEINLTPNRPDCAGVHGIDRDLAAAEIRRFKDSPIKPVVGVFPCPVSLTLDFGATPSLCRGFALRLVRGVRNGASPEWLQRRLTAIGLRPINALVDITNYITYDRGRPLHVFDAAKVKGNLVVRRARPKIGYDTFENVSAAEIEHYQQSWHPVRPGPTPGPFEVGFLDAETIHALDGREYPLDDSRCCTAEERSVESLAGIMGGEASGCSEATTDVLIESALWDEVNVAHTGRKRNINSDARYRFDRGRDPAFMVPGLELATRMVLDICGGTPSAITSPRPLHTPDPPTDFPLHTLSH